MMNINLLHVMFASHAATTRSTKPQAQAHRNIVSSVPVPRGLSPMHSNIRHYVAGENTSAPSRNIASGRPAEKLGVPSASSEAVVEVSAGFQPAGGACRPWLV